MRERGFTLVELLVALFVMALMAALSWRGLDGMVRAKEMTQARADETLTLQVGLQQWTADLDAIEQLYGMKALEWNGRVLRLTRRSTASITDGVLVVGWTRRDVNGTSTWLRWQSAPVTTRGELEQAWQRADQWAQNPGDDDRAREVAIAPLDDWQLFYFRENAWTNPQSSDVTTNTINATATTGQLPDGVRLVLTLPPGHAVSGVVTRDWVRPQLGGGKGQP
jgi:general secretion pathway protein J